jgi:hypothetical protein
LYPTGPPVARVVARKQEGKNLFVLGVTPFEATGATSVKETLDGVTPCIGSVEVDPEFLELAFGVLENSFLVVAVAGILLDRQFVILDRALSVALCEIGIPKAVVGVWKG